MLAPAPEEDDKEVLVDGEMTVWSQVEDRALLTLAKALAGGNVQGATAEVWDALRPEDVPDALRRMRPRLLKERYAKLMRIFQERSKAAMAPAPHAATTAAGR